MPTPARRMPPRPTRRCASVRRRAWSRTSPSTASSTAARAVGADAVHPGYGFLAENADFAARCAGGRADLHRPAGRGDPAHGQQDRGARDHGRGGRAGRSRASRAPGSTTRRSRARRSALGLPLLVKASAGGGGKGMRLVRDAAALPDALAAARREAHARLRRRHAAARALLRRAAPRRGADLRRRARAASCTSSSASARSSAATRRSSRRRRRRRSTPRCARAWARRRSRPATAIGYIGAGTVEFILDRDGQFYFLEVNTRLQVEHPVTEAITGLDLVELQIRVAEGEPLPFAQDDVRIDGHAHRGAALRRGSGAPTSCRRPAASSLWEPAALPGVRYDSGVEAGTEVTRPLRSAAREGHRARRDARRGRSAADRRAAAARRGRRDDQPRLPARRARPPGVRRRRARHALHRAPPAGDARAPRARPGGRPRCTRSSPRSTATSAAAAPAGRCRPSIPSGWRNNRWRPQDVDASGSAASRSRCATSPARRALRGRGGRAARARCTVIGGDDRTRSTSRSTACAGASASPRAATRSSVHGPLGTRRARRGAALPGARQRRHGRRLPRADAGHRPRRCSSRSATGSTKGTVLLVLEAMKMEHPLVAHAPGP